MEEDIKILEDFIEIDRKTRNKVVISDYDKFCERRCVAIENLLKERQADKARIKELEERLMHRYSKKCPNCNKEFIAKRFDAKYCKECSPKVSKKKYREKNKDILREKSKINMRKWRANRKLKEDK